MLNCYIMQGLPGSGKSTYIKENLKYILKRKHFFDDAFWPTLKLYNEKLYIPRLLYKTHKKIKLMRKGVL